jgi:Cytochrome c peroxidase
MTAYKFKVPSLRNIALTYPYLHDGSSPTLEDTVRTMGWVQIGKKLTEDEIKSLVAFLKTLSDKDRVAVAIK